MKKFGLYSASKLLVINLATATTQIALACLLVPSAHAQTVVEQRKSLPMIQIKAGVYRINAEVARSPDERSVGLMNRKSMPPDQGMLFVFEQAGGYCFWMRNTLIPLTIAWLDETGRIVSMANMQPLSEQSHCPSTPAKFALEMNQGWFDKKGLKIGSKLEAPKIFSPSATK